MTGICTACQRTERVPSGRGERLIYRRSTCCAARLMGSTTRRCPHCGEAIMLRWEVGANESRVRLVVLNRAESSAPCSTSEFRFDPQKHAVHDCDKVGAAVMIQVAPGVFASPDHADEVASRIVQIPEAPSAADVCGPCRDGRHGLCEINLRTCACHHQRRPWRP